MEESAELAGRVVLSYDKIDYALRTTGIADDRATLRLLRSLPLDKGGLGMPLLNGHHGKRHHLITSMRTKEFLKLFYPSLVPDHFVLFNSQDIDLDKTPPDDLSVFILHLRARAPAEEDPLSIFIKACRQQSDGIDSSVSSAFHQQLLAAGRLETGRGREVPVFKASSKRLLSTLTDLA